MCTRPVAETTEPAYIALLLVVVTIIGPRIGIAALLTWWVALTISAAVTYGYILARRINVEHPLPYAKLESRFPVPKPLIVHHYEPVQSRLRKN